MGCLKFKAWMAENRISQGSLAELLDLSLQSVNKKVNGKEDFTLVQVRKICETYGLSADIFLPDTLQTCNEVMETQ